MRSFLTFVEVTTKLLSKGRMTLTLNHHLFNESMVISFTEVTKGRTRLTTPREV